MSRLRVLCVILVALTAVSVNGKKAPGTVDPEENPNDRSRSPGLFDIEEDPLKGQSRVGSTDSEGRITQTSSDDDSGDDGNENGPGVIDGWDRDAAKDGPGVVDGDDRAAAKDGPGVVDGDDRAAARDGPGVVDGNDRAAVGSTYSEGRKADEVEQPTGIIDPGEDPSDPPSRTRINDPQCGRKGQGDPSDDCAETGGRATVEDPNNIVILVGSNDEEDDRRVLLESRKEVVDRYKGKDRPTEERVGVTVTDDDRKRSAPVGTIDIEVGKKPEYFSDEKPIIVETEGFRKVPLESRKKEERVGVTVTDNDSKLAAPRPGTTLKPGGGQNTKSSSGEGDARGPAIVGREEHTPDPGNRAENPNRIVILTGDGKDDDRRKPLESREKVEEPDLFIELSGDLSQPDPLPVGITDLDGGRKKEPSSEERVGVAVTDNDRKQAAPRPGGTIGGGKNTKSSSGEEERVGVTETDNDSKLAAPRPGGTIGGGKNTKSSSGEGDEPDIVIDLSEPLKSGPLPAEKSTIIVEELGGFRRMPLESRKTDGGIIIDIINGTVEPDDLPAELPKITKAEGGARSKKPEENGIGITDGEERIHLEPLPVYIQKMQTIMDKNSKVRLDGETKYQKEAIADY